MKQILKRLELIKTAIEIEDEDIIKLQIAKINTFEYDYEVKTILELIEKHDFENIISYIDDYLNKYSGITVYEDPQIQGLKIELKYLEKILQSLNDEKSDYLHSIDTFNKRYNLELGALIQEILKLKEEQSLRELNETDIGLDEYQVKKEQYEKDKQKFERFNDTYIEELDKTQLKLSDEDKKELKSIYKKASKLCHPDIVVDTDREKAAEIFKVLNEAYSQNDLQKVKKILEDLELANEFNISSNSINDKDILKLKIQELKLKINNVKTDIAEIFKNETYIAIENIDNFDKYFSTLKEKLRIELDEIKNNNSSEIPTY